MTRYQWGRMSSWSAVIVGRSASMIGNWILLSLGTVIIYQETHNALFIALYYLFQGAPSLLVGPWIGYWAQHYKPQGLMIAADISRALILVGAALANDPWIFLITLFLLTGLGYVFSTGSSLLFNEWAGDRRDAFWSLMEVLHNLAVVVGPGLALLLMHLYSRHLSNALLWDAVSFVFSAMGITFLWRVPIPHRAPKLNQSTLSQVILGIKDLRKQPTQWSAVLTVYVMGIVAGYVSVLLIPYMTGHHIPVQRYPLLVLLEGIAGVAASMVSASRIRTNTKVLYLAAVLCLVAFLGLAWGSSQLIILAVIMTSMALTGKFAAVVQIQRLNAVIENRGALLTSVQSLENGLELIFGLICGAFLRLSGMHVATTIAIPAISAAALAALLAIVIRHRSVWTEHEDLRQKEG